MMLFYEMMWWIIHLWREKKCKMYYVLNSRYCNAMSIVIHSMALPLYGFISMDIALQENVEGVCL